MLLPNKGTPEGSPDDWLEHAASDLKVARLAHEEILSEHVCFHAQQAAEKAIKAVFWGSIRSSSPTKGSSWLLSRKSRAESPWKRCANTPRGERLAGSAR